MRLNAVAKIMSKQPLFEGVLGYEDTVMPQLENAILAGHDVIFLGERGQAKTRMIRSLTGLLDEWMPIVGGSEINDDPYNPVSRHARDLVAEMGDAYPDGAVDAVLFWMADQGRMGKKANAGFYTYDATGKREGLWSGLAAQYPQGEDPELTTVQHRLLMAQVLEAVRALQDGVLTDIREGDVGAILGWGFAPWSGGPFGWLDIIGAAKAVEICDALTATYGARFAAPALLRDMAAKGATFYPQAVAKAA